jgi:hypothetical protein
MIVLPDPVADTVVAQSFCVASVATSWGFSVLWVVFLVGGVLGVRG